MITTQPNHALPQTAASPLLLQSPPLVAAVAELRLLDTGA